MRDKIDLEKLWAITDFDESTNEGYGSERAFYSPLDDKSKGFTFSHKKDAAAVLRNLKLCHRLSLKARVEKVELVIQSVE